MTVALASNFFLNARGLSFTDTASVTWALNKNTNSLTATASGGGGGPTSANPSATIGLSAVDGSAATFMTSDSAPPLSQAIAPTWTGQHTFTPGSSETAIIVNTTANNVGVSVQSGSGSGAIVEVCGDGSGTGNGLSFTQTSVGAGLINLNYNAALTFKVNGTNRMTINADGGLVVGAPTGGVDEGAGTINCQGLYVNGTAITTPVGANPSATIGLATVNGSAATFLRSDGAPALSQAIVPTWTGLHTWTAGVNAAAIVANGGTNTGNAFLAKLITGTAAGFSSGLYIQAGTNASDAALLINNAADSVTLLELYGDGGMVLNSATGGDKGVGTINDTGGYYVNGVLVGSILPTNALFQAMVNQRMYLAQCLENGADTSNSFWGWLGTYNVGAVATYTNVGGSLVGSVPNLQLKCSALAGSQATLQDSSTGASTGVFVTTSSSISAAQGFSLYVVFAIGATTATTQRIFVGLATKAQPALGSFDPSHYDNLVGFSKDAGDANLQFITANATTANKTDLGSGTTPANLSLVLVGASIVCPSAGSPITYSLTNLATGAVIASGSTATDLPAANAPLVQYYGVGNGAGATAIDFIFVRSALFTQA